MVELVILSPCKIIFNISANDLEHVYYRSVSVNDLWNTWLFVPDAISFLSGRTIEALQLAKIFDVHIHRVSRHAARASVLRGWGPYLLL